MASAKLEVRAGDVLIAAIDAAAARNGRTRSAEVLDALAERYLGADTEAAPVARAAPKARAVIPADPRKALAQAEARQGVRSVARLDTSMVPVFNGAKRPAYQKGQAGQGKARR